ARPLPSKHDVEGRAVAGTLGFGPDPPAVGLHHYSGRIETEPRAGNVSGARRAVRRFEDVLGLFASQPHAAIADRDLHLVVGVDLDLARRAGGAVFERVLHDVSQHLRDALRIPVTLEQAL